MYLKGGKGQYRTVDINSTMPSLGTVRNSMQKRLEPIEVGIVDVNKIVKFLSDRNYPKHVIVSCDETRVSRKIEYDFKSDKLVGLTAPINQVTGFPDLSEMKTSIPSEILETIGTRSLSSYVDVFMLKPLTPGSASMCITAIPTDNKYTKSDKLKQFNHIVCELATVGIKVEGFSSDGDEKYFGAQKSLIEFGNLQEWHGMKLYGNPKSQCGASQDFLHMLQKFRWRAFDSHYELKLNNKVINASFLKMLIQHEDVSRETFGISLRELENKDKSNDKMNCKVTLKLCSWKIIDALVDVPGSEGLQQYLKLLTMLHDACMLDETEINIQLRLFNLSYVASFIRRWKTFNVESGGKALNFITPNAFACVETNLVFYIRLLDAGYGNMFHLCNSQACEEAFRTMRSFGSWGFTQINFSMNVGLNLLSKMNLLMDVMNELSKSDVKFSEKFADQAFPLDSRFIPIFLSGHEKREIVECALKKAEEDISRFGITSSECDVGAILKNGDPIEDLLSQQSHRNDFVGKQWPVKKSTVNGRQIISIKNLHFVDEPHEKQSKFVRLPKLTSTQETIISKQQFLNLIDVGSIEKVSKDRTRRFIANEI